MPAGLLTSHSQYGRQFQVDTYDTMLPATIQGIRRYLGLGLIKGIGPKMAERIADHFGQATLEVIEQSPGRLARGARPWTQTHRDDHDRVGGTEGHQGGDGLPPRRWRLDLAGGAIYKTYRDEAIQVVQSEPYRHADVWGIGFKTADQPRPAPWHPS